MMQSWHCHPVSILHDNNGKEFLFEKKFSQIQELNRTNISFWVSWKDPESDKVGLMERVGGGGFFPVSIW